MDGVVVGSDQTQEWMLSWWWDRYRKHNDYPVVFMDFGMSEDAKEWCLEKGGVIRVEPVEVCPREAVSPELAAIWESLYTCRFWSKREAWFRKPKACLKTPFSRSLWLDLDCELRGPIKDLFPMSGHPSGVALMREESEKRNYNAGVIAFRKEAPLMEAWDRLSREQNHLFCGDQDVLSHIIFTNDLEVCELPKIYNWGRLIGENPDAVILHWHGDAGKCVIAHQILRDNLEI